VENEDVEGTVLSVIDEEFVGLSIVNGMRGDEIDWYGLFNEDRSPSTNISSFDRFNRQIRGE